MNKNEDLLFGVYVTLGCLNFESRRVSVLI